MVNPIFNKNQRGKMIMRSVFLRVASVAWFAMWISVPARAADGKKDITFGMAFRGEEPALTTRSGIQNGWLDNQSFEWIEFKKGEKPQSFQIDARSGKRKPYVRPEGEGSHGRSAYQATTDHKGEAWVQNGDLYYFNRDKNLTKRLTSSKGVEKNPRFSPDGRWLAYTRDHNLFAMEIESGLEHQLTQDGSDTVYNGYASWVYYEEILGRSSRYCAFWWSPDSTKLLYMRFDDSPVPTFSIFHEEGTHGELEATRYPKPGDPNPWVRMGVVEVAKGDTVWMDFEEKQDAYLAWPFWIPGSQRLHVQWLNRDQNHLILYECDAANGTKKAIYEERQKSWVEFFSDITYLEDGSGFLLRSDKDGRHHLYFHAMDGTLKAQLTTGALMVDRIEGVDEKAGKVYFSGREEDTGARALYSVGLTGKGLTQITQTGGTHRVTISPDFRYFLDDWSDMWTEPKTLLCRIDGSLVREVANSHNPEADAYQKGVVEYFKIPTSDGLMLPAWWVIPEDLDRSASHAYAVIFRIYSGPAAPTVLNRYQWRWSDFYYANHGVIIISVDHRASGHFGKEGTANMYRKLGQWEIHDLVDAVKWLREKPFIDPARIGITGGSYGGYMTLYALVKAPDYFTHGVSISPVTDWRLYDTVYTERYMDLPEDNPEGYREGSVLEAATNLKGKLLLAHGTIDDNVHFQQSLQLIDKLTNADIPFELMIYPGSRHGIRQHRHLSDLANQFWFRHFLHQPYPEVEPGGN